MKFFISFQKAKALFISTPEVVSSNEELAHQINHELMVYGYFLGKSTFDKLAIQSTDYLNSLYTDLIGGIVRVVGGPGHLPLYRNFPQSIKNSNYTGNIQSIVTNFWLTGTWGIDDYVAFDREFKLELIKYKEIGTLTENEYNSIFTDIIYSNKSISKFDKEIITHFIHEGAKFDFTKIQFKEISAFVGKELLDDKNITLLPTKDATTVLRIYSAYSGGDEGLKENTRFKNPSSRQRRVLLNTLNSAFNLEESFKIYREKWLKVLFYLNPLFKANLNRYPEVGKYSNFLRNTPKVLKTFNSKVEALLIKKDPAVLDLLSKRSGAFMRRLDHTVIIFGFDAIKKWLDTNPNVLNLVTTYNHFTDRDKAQAGRGAILASQGQSNVVTYDAKAPLDSNLVSKIKLALLDKIKQTKSADLAGKKVFIDRTLYYRPVSMNNRASSLSLNGTANGTVEIAPESEVIRLYVHWNQRNDIDLSAMLIDDSNNVTKVGWNGSHNMQGVTYSGDNRGHHNLNAEYIDIETKKLPIGTQWVILDARIFSGPKNFAGYNGGVHTGWMTRDYPEANTAWLPKTIQNAVVLNNSANTAYLLAYHVPTRNIVYLDLAMGSNSVTTAEDALKMRIFLESFVTFDDGKDEINWDKFNQGHILNALSEEVVDDVKDADIVFSEDKTNWETVAKYM